MVKNVGGSRAAASSGNAPFRPVPAPGSPRRKSPGNGSGVTGGPGPGGGSSGPALSLGASTPTRCTSRGKSLTRSHEGRVPAPESGTDCVSTTVPAFRAPERFSAQKVCPRHPPRFRNCPCGRRAFSGSGSPSGSGSHPNGANLRPILDVLPVDLGDGAFFSGRRTFPGPCTTFTLKLGLS